MTMQADVVFEPLARDPACPFCNGQRPVPAFEIDAAYCLTLTELPHREAYVVRHFHEIGLCRHVILRRARRDKVRPGFSIWQSHRDAACRSLAMGHKRVLIMEDDVAFTQSVEQFAPRVSRAINSLPADWWGLYLGHVPAQAYFVGRNVLRTKSGALHAYIAHTPMLEWYAKHRPRSVDVPMWPLLRPSVDSATALLPKMYALFPMVALQKNLGDQRIDAAVTHDGRRRSLFDFDRYRYAVLFYGMRVAEILAVLGSPLHWLTLDRSIARSARSTGNVQRIRASGLFDEDYYLATYPDVATTGMDPLTHYINDGEREGRRPNPSFDPKYYTAHVADLKPGDSALFHYIAIGRARGDATEAHSVA